MLAHVFVQAMRNTKLLKTYADLDPRVAVLGYAFKHFAKVCLLWAVVVILF